MNNSASGVASILVVDDDPSFLTYIEELFKRNNFSVLSARNGMDAIRLATEHTPDLIVLDVMMPEMSGGMTAQHLSRDERTRDIPIIFLTSVINESQEMLIDNKEGSYQFLAKPIRAGHLLEHVNRVLGLR